MRTEVLSKRLSELSGSDADAAAAYILTDVNIELEPFLTSIRLALTDERTELPRAYRHDNGYIKIELAASSQSKALARLNVWSPEFASMENLHNHKWDYCSLVVVGCLDEQIFTESTAGMSYYRYYYHPRLARQSYHLEAAGTAVLSEYSHYRWRQGQIYHRSHDLIHRVRPIAGRIAASLQLTYRPDDRDRSDVFSPKPLATDEQPFPSPQLPVADILQAVDKVLTALKEEPGGDGIAQEH